ISTILSFESLKRITSAMVCKTSSYIATVNLAGGLLLSHPTNMPFPCHDFVTSRLTPHKFFCNSNQARCMWGLGHGARRVTYGRVRSQQTDDEDWSHSTPTPPRSIRWWK